MNFYHVYTGDKVEQEVIQICQPPRLMLSYYHFRTKTIEEIKTKLGYDFDYIYDSGAFSAWTKGIEIDLDKYIEKIKNENIVNYISLDIFGDNEASFKNFMLMREAGLNPIPVVHVENQDNYLEKYIELGCNVICIGGTVAMKDKTAVSNYVRMFTWQYPHIDFHLLGSTSSKIINTCNIASCDSSTWIMKAIFGQPKHIQGTDREAKKQRAIYNLKLELSIQKAIDKTR